MCRIIARLTLSLSVCLLLTACSSTQYKTYRAGDLSVEEKKADDPERPYGLAYVEFDDQGDFWEPGQLDSALQFIDRVNEGAGYDSQGNSIGSIFVTFVHGWRNDAQEGNGNLSNFRKILKRLAEDERRAAETSNPPRPARPVAGIYVAWRGDALWTVRPLRWLDVFTFWNRNAAAVRIASRPPATQAFLLMLKEIQGKNNARSIVVGHSLGAMIVERAMSQALVGIITEAKYRAPCEACSDGLEPGEFKPPADLIVLVNSAAPALQSKHLVEVLEKKEVSEETGRHDDVPLLLSITAENDRATRGLFPIAMKLESRRQKFRDDTNPGQRELLTRTAGHTPFLYSHERLGFDAKAACLGAADDLPLNVLRCRAEEGSDSSTAIFTVGERKYTIRRNAKASNHTPYWILQAPRSVIDNHSGFFTDQFINFLRGLIIVTGASRPGAPKIYSTDVTAETK